MMNDTRQIRQARLAKDETDLSALLNKTVAIRLNTSLPFMHIEQAYIDKTEYKTEDYASKADADLFNTLVDPTYTVKDNNGNDVTATRFTFLTEINSSVTFSRSRMYYDAKYEDIIIVPDLESLGATSVTDGSYELQGYVVGGLGNVDQVADAINPVKDTAEYKLPLVNKNIASSTIFLETRGVGYAARRNVRVYRDTANGVRFFNNDTSTVALIKLGKVTDIFTSAVKLPLYQYYQSGIKEYSGKYLGVVDTKDADIYVAINF